MKVRFFVAGSAALLAVWLTATFFSEVPVERYPQFGKGSVPVSAKVPKTANEEKPMVSLDPDRVPMATVE